MVNIGDHEDEIRGTEGAGVHHPGIEDRDYMYTPNKRSFPQTLLPRVLDRHRCEYLARIGDCESYFCLQTLPRNLLSFLVVTRLPKHYGHHSGTNSFLSDMMEPAKHNRFEMVVSGLTHTVIQYQLRIG